MAHARKTIRDGIITLLNAAPSHPTRKWKQTFNTREPEKRRVEPYNIVFAGDETVTPMNTDTPLYYLRTCEFFIEGHLQINAKDGVTEDRMEAYCADIETRLTHAKLQAVVPKIKNFRLVDTSMDVSDENEKQIAQAVVLHTWQAQYVTAEGAPETLI